MDKKAQYIKDPCRASSIPYWKAVSMSVPENMQILHHDDLQGSMLAEYVDEPYFRLKHSLCGIKPVAVPDGFIICKASLADFASHINSCYGGNHMTVDKLRGYTAGRVYCSELWIAVRDKVTGQIVATGIAELDREIGEGVLEWIQVSKEYRRCGLGCFIVKELLWRMKDTAKFVTVSGQCENSSEPEKLYRKCGFAGNDIWHVLKRLRAEQCPKPAIPPECGL